MASRPDPLTSATTLSASKEGAPSLFGDYAVFRLLIRFRNELSPIGRRRELPRSGVGAAWSDARHIDQNDRQTSLGNARASCAARPMISRAGCTVGNPAMPFLQINHEQRSVGIEGRQSMFFPFA
jgi:hypothetical protein